LEKAEVVFDDIARASGRSLVRNLPYSIFLARPTSVSARVVVSKTDHGLRAALEYDFNTYPKIGEVFSRRVEGGAFASGFCVELSKRGLCKASYGLKRLALTHVTGRGLLK